MALRRCQPQHTCTMACCRSLHTSAGTSPAPSAACMLVCLHIMLIAGALCLLLQAAHMQLATPAELGKTGCTSYRCHLCMLRVRAVQQRLLHHHKGLLHVLRKAAEPMRGKLQHIRSDWHKPPALEQQQAMQITSACIMARSERPCFFSSCSARSGSTCAVALAGLSDCSHLCDLCECHGHVRTGK